MALSQNRTVFYLLVFNDGLPYMGAETDSVECSPETLVMHFVDLVRAKNADLLRRFSTPQLKVHLYTDPFDPESGHVGKPENVGESRGSNPREPLLIVVPDRKRTIAESRLDIHPDSQRLGELFPPNEKLTNQRLYFVNRDAPMKTLLQLHFSHYRYRSLGAGERDLYQFPLMDSLFGMGKTSFARRYLALIEKLIQSNENASSELCQFLVNSLTPWSPAKEPTNTPIDPKELKLVQGFLDDMKQARTLFLSFNKGTLFDSETRFESLHREFSRGLKPWGITLPDNINNIEALVEFIPKPVFIAFDDIGSAFEKPGSGIDEQRSQFFEFVEDGCIYLLRTDQVYFLLCGRAKFMWEVGVRSEQFQEWQSSPGMFTRINLNPIREEYLREILEHTSFDESITCAAFLCEKYPRKSLERIIKELYALTGGHPRSLFQCLRNTEPLAGAPNIDKMIDEVAIALQKYPSAILGIVRGVVADRTFDLSQETMIHNRWVSYQYLASRLHAGYGINLKATKLFLPPPILSYILWSNFEYVEYLRAYGSTLRKHYVDKARVFEETFIKWIQACCAASAGRTFKEAMAGFCPDNSILANVNCQLDTNKVMMYSQVRSNASDSSTSTISVEAFSDQIADYLNNQGIHIVFPAQKSESPDIMIMPPIEGQDKILIGVQAKCWDPKSTITLSHLKSEIEKLKTILFELRRRNGCEKTKGVLIMFGSCKLSVKLLGKGDKDKESIIWPGSDNDLEVILLNLTTTELRKRFFSLPIGTSESVGFVAQSVEDLIKS